MRIKNVFLGGKMNKSVDERILKNGEYRDAENIRVANSEDSDAGAIENVLGNEKLSNIDFGTNAFSIGIYSETFSDSIYWFVVSDSGSYICVYNEETGITSLILKDTRVGAANILNFSKDYLITGVNTIVDNDNGDIYLLWTDNLNPPRFINIERAKSYAENGFDNADISTIKIPPLEAPVTTLSSTVSDEENNLEERFLRFATRYQYLDGQYSAFSSFTETAFLPKAFEYDYAISSNESMINSFNQVNIQFKTGSKNVKAIDVIFKESGSNGSYLVDSYNKEAEGWADDINVNIDFSNDKTYKVLPEQQLLRLFDAVPLLAKAQEVIGNRIVYGNYTSDYNIEDCAGDKIDIDFDLSKVTTPIVEGVATESVKSIRNYEVVQVYLDEQGRMTTGLPSRDNTIFIPNSDCLNKNQIKVNLRHKAPCFAKKFRFFVKQSRYDYDTVVPTLFYKDGLYTWVKLEGNDINKIQEGDFLYVKADTQEILDNVVQTKVLEIKTQEENFLEDISETEVKQLAGKYFKIKPRGYRMNEEDFMKYYFESYDSSSNKNDNPIRGEVNVVEIPVYYGASGLDDLLTTGSYTGSDDIRYIVEIFTVGVVDTFRWSNDDGATWSDNGGLGYDITGIAQLMESGISLTFTAITGHDIEDKWIVSAKNKDYNGFGGNERSKAYAFYKSIPSNGNINNDDVIEGGARISIVYDEYNDEVEYIAKDYIASKRYANLEEWFYGDNIQPDLGISENRIWFRRGNIGSDFGTDASYFSQDPTGDMCLIILSTGEQASDLDKRVQVDSTFSIFQSDQDIIFETKEKLESNDIFYEVGRTYNIDENFNHLGFDGNDVNQATGVEGEFILPMFNCYAWGNGFESYKIKDSWNATSFKIDTRVSGIIEDYKRSVRIASLTYSEVFEQTTNYNGLNEFNLSLAPYKDMDDRYNSIQKLFTKDTDLTVYQEDKVHKVLYQKDVLYDADGSGNIRQSENVLGQEVAYTGEFGISTSPESHAVYGNSEYFTDTRRGVLLRKSIEGLETISRYGLEDWFRDFFRLNPKIRRTGAYDFYNGQYILFVKDYVIVYDESVKGFTSFFTFIPESMVSLNNNFYSIKEGQIYIHNSENVNHNEFYGVQSPSKVSIIVNENPSDVKELHAISLEGSDSWNALITAYVSTVGDDIQSSIKDVEFFKKEGMWYAYTRRNEDETHLDSKSTYGIGEVVGVGVDNIVVKGTSSSLTNNDKILKGDLSIVGDVISNSSIDGFTTITLTSLGTITVGDFVFGMKNARVEGGNLRGYSMRVDLDITKDNKIELFAVNSEVVKSFS